MPYSETAFETLGIALESTRGTAITNPTHLLNVEPTILLPRYTKVDIPYQDGTLFNRADTHSLRKEGEVSFTGPLDLSTLPVLLNMGVAPVTSPTTPGGATLTRQWTFTPPGTTDTVKTATIWTGDPNVQVWRAAYGFLTTLSFGFDVNSDEVPTMSGTIITQTPATVADPTYPAMLTTQPIFSTFASLTLDTSSGLGTTAFNDIVTANFTLNTGINAKYVAAVSSNFTYGALGRGKANRGLEVTFSAEVPDTDLEVIYAADTVVKMRFRFAGTLIESSTYHLLEIQAFGVLRDLDMGTNRDSNRTHQYTFKSAYNSTLGADYSIIVQNTRTSL